MRVVVLVDGEHYPPVVRAAIGGMRSRGDDVAAAVFLGGTEKIREGDLDAAYGIAVERGDDRAGLVVRAVREHGADAVVDLSDEPVISATERFRLAGLVLREGASYVGADFELRPVPLAAVVSKPCIRVIATGKRVGKTAVAGALARHAVARGWRPVVVAMGRGGPEDPVVVEAGAVLGPPELLALADAGRHAASDYLEDAVTSRVTTIGCRRVGGGLAGAPWESNVVEGARIAEAREEDLVILEGSGSCVPPVAAGAGLLCVAAGSDPALVRDHLGPYRVLLADLAVVTMSENVDAASATADAIHGVAPSVEIVRSVFRPKPLSEVSGRRVFFCSTAPPRVGPVLRAHLEEVHGCEVVGMSHGLADRAVLERELREAPGYDVLLTELKAGAVDVAVRIAVGDDRDVAFADNALVGEGVDGAFDRLLALAATGGR